MKKLIKYLIKAKRKDLALKILSKAGSYTTTLKIGNDYLYVTYPTGRGGANLAVAKNNGKYFVLALKRNKIWTPSVLLRYPGNFDNSVEAIQYLYNDVKKDGYLNYFKENLTPKQFIDLVLVKESLMPNIFQKWFPELEKQTTEEESTKVGRFDVVFGIDLKDVEKRNIIDFISKASNIVKGFGLESALYGKVIVVKTLGSKNIADYVGSTDSIRVSKALAKKYNKSMIKTFIHELGHRLIKLNKVDRYDIIQKFKEVTSYSNSLNIDKGDEFIDKDGNTLTITSFEYNRGAFNYVFKSSDGKTYKAPYQYFINLQKIKGKPPEDTAKWLPSAYSTKDWEEWFCEILGYGLVNDVKDYKIFVKGVLK